MQKRYQTRGDNMHTPDGFITNWICVVGLLISLSALGFAFYDLKKKLTKEKAIWMAGLAAGIFGLQMLNFPVASGTSGHLIGASLVAILMGPSAAVVVLAAVLLVQTFVYADGGVLALGINILNMGVIAGYTSFYTYSSLKKTNKGLAVISASWLSVVAASVASAVQIGLSGAAPMLASLKLMGSYHMLIGVGEAVITGGIVLYVLSTKHELLSPSRKIAGLAKYTMLSVLLGMFVIAAGLPFASGSPDGLEAVALNLGFFGSAVEIYTLSPMPGYTFLGSETYPAVLSAGIIGMLLTFAAGIALTAPIVRKAEA